jgi:glycosyltransferase involved in cell wall biosynthesis
MSDGARRPQRSRAVASQVIIVAVRIALVSPPMLPVPPLRYGGVERIVAVLADGMHRRGHEVTLFAPGDSTAPGRLVATVERGLWNEGFSPDPSAHFRRTVELVRDRAPDFDVIHSHIDQHGFALAIECGVPVVSTIHGRTDAGPLAAELQRTAGIPLVAISESQRSFVPHANWVATIHHGLPLADSPPGDGSGGFLLFVGRLSADKGVTEVVDAARRAGRRLVIAAKALAPNELEIYGTVVAPAVAHGQAEFLGEVARAQRDLLFARAHATLVLSRWPEPFGLVAIESLATGTPVIASRTGALPEIVEDGVDGFVVDDPAQAAEAVRRIGQLDRRTIRRRALARFSGERMVADYEALFTRVIGSFTETSQAPRVT